MRKLWFCVLMMLAMICRASASDDFYYRFDFNAFDEGRFVCDGWECDGSVSIYNEDSANMLSVGADSSADFHMPAPADSDVVIMKLRLCAERNDGFAGVYILNREGRACFSLGFLSDGTIAAYTGGKYVSLRSYDAGQWYDIKCVLDMENSKFSVDINGETAICDAEFRNRADISVVRLYTQRAGALVRDLRIYRNTVRGIRVASGGCETELFGTETDISCFNDGFVIDFYKKMMPETVNRSTVTLTQEQTGREVLCTVTPSADGMSCRIKPESPLGAGAYRITVRGGENGVRDVGDGRISGSCVILRIHIIRQSVSVARIGNSVTVTNLSSIPQSQQLIIAADGEYRTAQICEQPYLAVTVDAVKGGELFVLDLPTMIPLGEKIIAE